MSFHHDADIVGRGADRLALCIQNPQRRSALESGAASSGEFPLYSAAAGGRYDDVKRMLEAGANPSMRTKYLWTALHWAVAHGHTNVVQLLLAYNADVNAASDTGKTPLDMAETDHMRQLLRRRGAR